MKFPTLTLLLLLSGCGMAYADQVDFSSLTYTTHISTCDSLWTCYSHPEPMETEDYIWKESGVYYVFPKPLYSLEETTETFRDQGMLIYCKWRKVPYKIEWHCVEWKSKYPGGVVWDLGQQYCTKEQGYREDGAVVWRKVKP